MRAYGKSMTAERATRARGGSSAGCPVAFARVAATSRRPRSGGQLARAARRRVCCAARSGAAPPPQPRGEPCRSSQPRRPRSPARFGGQRRRRAASHARPPTSRTSPGLAGRRAARMRTPASHASPQLAARLPARSAMPRGRAARSAGRTASQRLPPGCEAARCRDADGEALRPRRCALRASRRGRRGGGSREADRRCCPTPRADLAARRGRRPRRLPAAARSAAAAPRGEVRGCGMPGCPARGRQRREAARCGAVASPTSQPGGARRRRGAARRLAARSARPGSLAARRGARGGEIPKVRETRFRGP